MERILLHSCCAPCSVFCVDSLRRDGIEPASLWYNPNIHPYQEYKMRRDTLLQFAEMVSLDVRVLDEYGLRRFVRETVSHLDDRCGACYAMRLFPAAQYAAERGFSAFTTSLLISPYQKHELIRAVGEEAAKAYGISFFYRDFRPGFREGQAKAREMGLYLQKYCGCIFSEEERYAKQITRDQERFSAS